MFINRKEELKDLNAKWARKNPQLIVVYGKRRVGKTELIKQFIKNKSGIYFLADKRTAIEQLRELSRIIGSYFNDSLVLKQGFGDWLDVFAYLKEKSKKPFIFAIDEYPYLVEIDKATSSIFQKGWDEYLKQTGIFLILSGSSVSMMESEALIYKAPLYGRRTGQIYLKPMPFKESRKFFPDKKFEDFLKIFTITGGMPAYLLQFDTKLSLEENIKSRIFNKTEFLHNEIEFILKEELREPKNYLSILKAIAWGKTKFGEIVNETGLEKNILNKYLGILERLQLIEKEIPVTEKHPQKSRKGIYKISDNFCRFWFQYVFPYKSDLEIGRLSEVLRKLKESFRLLESTVYEKITQEFLHNWQDKIFHFERVGRWWDGKEEIDLIGISQQKKEVIFGEVKWRDTLIGINILDDLKRKSEIVLKNLEYKEKYKKHYILFSKKGFTKELRNLAKKENVFLVEKDKLLKQDRRRHR
ncbi:MAG: ATP-binding protein [Candidatus Omnitrophota bacterium]